ncbi:MAG: glycosyltransferase family 2 protein [Candidatus Aenigmatarchaeota archaeon]
MKKLPLSVVIITLNEEKHIRECLESVKFADEIIIVDSFSKDKTINIAKKFGCKIYKRKFDGFGQLKNYGIEKAKNLWILNIDADERVTNELREEIENVLKNPKHDGYYIPRKSFIGKKWIKYAGQWPDYQLRLFRKDKGKFEEKIVHERVIVNGKVSYLRNPLIHYNYENWHHYFVKSNIYSTREAQELLNKKFVTIYPINALKDFIKNYFKALKNGNSLIGSYIISRTSLENYEVWWIIPFKPLFAFLRFFIIQQGFRDGVYGLFWALGAAYNRIMKYAKYYDMKKGKNKKSYDNLNY